MNKSTLNTNGEAINFEKIKYVKYIIALMKYSILFIEPLKPNIFLKYLSLPNYGLFSFFSVSNKSGLESDLLFSDLKSNGNDI